MKPTRADTATPTAVATATPQPALFDCRSASMIPMAECEALVALYANTDGAHWSDSSGWLTDASPCEWYGVQCADGVVVGLSLPGNQLTGVIPSSLKDLARLETLDLSGNQFTGSIPPVLAELSSLVGLALSTNQLTGDIPPELALLSGLVALDLAGNQLTGSIPPELAELPNLVALGLASNQLTGSIPPEFAELAYLSALSLSDNPLTGGIPLGLMNLTLTWFEYANTGLCEPLEPQFQAWLQSIPHLTRTGVACPN